jgi:putative hydrolase
MAVPDAELRVDMHVHSTFSDDAVSTIAENIAAAHAAGLERLRLIDHVRQSTTWVPQFLEAVRAASVPRGLELLTGVEAKMMDATGRLDTPHDLVVGPGGVDAVVIADHQFPGTDGPWSPEHTRGLLESGALEPEAALDLLVAAYVGAMRSVASAQLAHPFSILPKIGLGEDQLSDGQLARFSAAVAESATLVEVNEKWGCPSPRVLRAVRRAGGTIVGASDAHVATEVGVYGELVVAALARSREGAGGLDS